jgi:hypothetical protein
VLSCLLARRLAKVSELSPNLTAGGVLLSDELSRVLVAKQEFGASWKNRRPEKKTTGVMESSATPIQNFWEKFADK